MSILDKMGFRALDENFNVTSIIENVDSIIWTERYSELGTFEINGAITDSLLDVATNSRYILNTATSRLMCIENVATNYGEENQDTITISGRPFEAFLDRRIILKQKTFINRADPKISSIIHDLVKMSFDSTTPERYWDKLSYSNLATSGNTPILPPDIPLQFTIGENLLDVILGLCKPFGLGFRCTYSQLTGEFTFVIYEGVDRTASDVPTLMFSDLYDNIKTAKEEFFRGHVKTFAFVVGGYEDSLTKLPLLGQSTDLGATGLDRREDFLKIDQQKSEYRDDGSTVTISDAKYIGVMKKAGADLLNSPQNSVRRIYDGELLDMDHVYGTDFNLGDKVGLYLPYGQKTRVFLKGVTFSVDADGVKSLLPEFDYESKPAGVQE